MKAGRRRQELKNEKLQRKRERERERERPGISF
jgi:hypothetical protein